MWNRDSDMEYDKLWSPEKRAEETCLDNRSWEVPKMDDWLSNTQYDYIAYSLIEMLNVYMLGLCN